MFSLQNTKSVLRWNTNIKQYPLSKPQHPRTFNPIKYDSFFPRSFISSSVPLLKKKEVIVKNKDEIRTQDFVDQHVRPIKELTLPLKSSGGRNRMGRITVRHRGGGHKQRYRLIDFKRSMQDVPAIVTRIERDPNRNTPIALLMYETGHLSYILAPSGIKPGDIVKSSTNAPIKVGYSTPLSKIPIGTLVHNIEMVPGKGGQLCRAAGTSAQILKHSPAYTILKLASGEIRQLNTKCLATIGTVANYDYKPLGKAGASRWRGIRPSVRGVAMNPVDHPHGGGQGKTKGGRHSCSPWGVLTKGYVTRNPRKHSKNFIIKNKRAIRRDERALKQG